MADQMDRDRLLELTAQIVSAHVGGNSLEAGELPTLIASVYRTLSSVETVECDPVSAEPAIPIKRSVFRDRLVCIECGKSFKTIKRHLNTDHGLAPEAYRSKWGLPTSYPMVAPDYAATRSKLAVSLGLGRKRQDEVVLAEPAVKVTKIAEVKRGRRRKGA